ncbi:hypothetical protein ABPG75_006748 [Micractinium tetrahymenae]
MPAGAAAAQAAPPALPPGVAAGASEQQHQLLPAVAEMPSPVPSGESGLASVSQPPQAGVQEPGALPGWPQAQPFAAEGPQSLPAQSYAAAPQPRPQAQAQPAPISPQISQLSQIDLQPASPPAYSPGGLSAWQAPLPAQPAAPEPPAGAGALPAGQLLGSPPGPSTATGFQGFTSPTQADLLAAQHQVLLQQQQAAQAVAAHQQQQAVQAAAAQQQQQQEQQQAAALAAALQQHQQQQQQAAAVAGLHPAAAAVLAAADPATRAIILAALQQHQEQEAAAEVAEQQQHRQAAALAAVQQQQTAFLSAQQQQQQQDLLDTQHRAASVAASADQQQQQALFLAQQQAQALLASQQQHLQHMQHMQGALLPRQPQAGPFAAYLPGSPPQGLPGTAQFGAGAGAPAYLPAMPPAPPPSITPSQLLRLQQLQQPASPAQVDRQLSQALSGYSVGSEPPAGASVAMPLPQHPLAFEQHPALHAVLPAGEPPLRYSPSPVPSRSLDDSGGQRAGGAAGGTASRYPHRHSRQHPQAHQAAAAAAETVAGLSAFAGPGQCRPRIKAVISSGGRFVQPGVAGRASGGPTGGLSTAAAISAAAPGSWTYAGGETRLVSLPDSCTLLELLAVLSSKKQRAAVAGFLSPGATGASGGGGAQPGGARGPNPGSPYWSPGAGDTPAGPLSVAASTKGSSAERPGGLASGAALTSPASLTSAADTMGTSALASAAAAVAEAAGGRASGLQKLCILRYKLPSEPGLFVDVVDDEDVRLMFEEYADWVAEGTGSLSGVLGRKLHIFVEWLPPATAGRHSAESADSDLRGAAPGQAHFTPSDSSLEEHSPLAPQQQLSTKVSDLTSNKIEVIPAGDVQLLAHIGGGTFGDTYRGRWHESDVAVKCINPLMIGVQYASRQAWVDFLRDANQMGKLRHGNLCEVYGVVLPHDSDPRLAAPRSRSEPNAAGAAGGGAAPEAPAAGEAALAAAPPRPALPAPGEAHAAQPQAKTGSPPPTGAAMLMQREATLPPVASTLPQLLPGPVANPPAIVMEFVAGRSLGSAINAGSDLVSSRLARVVYALDTAKALSYLHSRKVAHLDLKSGNVLLGWRDRRPTAKIAGYGLTGRKVSMVRSAAQGVTSAASMLPWTAPEVFRTPEYVTGKADVYSFAVLMYELWTLRKPFEGQDAMELLARVQAGEVVRPALPGTNGEPHLEEPGPGWRELLERCWAEDPEQRPDFSVIEEELRGIAREVKRQQGPPRARPSAATPAAQPARAGPRPALPPGLPRPRSGTNLAAAAAAAADTATQDQAAGAPAAAVAGGAHAEAPPRSRSDFLIVEPLAEGTQAAQAAAEQQQQQHQAAGP